MADVQEIVNRIKQDHSARLSALHARYELLKGVQFEKLSPQSQQNLVMRLQHITDFDSKVTKQTRKDYEDMLRAVQMELADIEVARKNGNSPAARVINFTELKGYHVVSLFRDLVAFLEVTMQDLDYIKERQKAEKQLVKNLSAQTYNAFLQAWQAEINRYRESIHRYEKVFNRHRKIVLEKNKVHYLLLSGIGAAAIAAGSMAILPGMLTAAAGLFLYYRAMERVEIAEVEQERSFIKRLRQKKVLFDRWFGKHAISGKPFLATN